MPASTLDPVSAALRNSLSKNSDEFLSTQLSGSSRRILATSIEFEPSENYHSTVLTNLKSKYIVLTNKSVSPSKKPDMGAEETLAPANRILYPIDAVQLGWNNTEWNVGAGMVNMGNTCYLNSTLQALFHVPSLVNWLLSDKQHMVQCEDAGGGQGGCIICAMSKTLQASQQRNTNAIRPWLVYSKLRIVCRHLVPGRQEDAHEFLRYLVEAMERAYIQRFRNMPPLDTRSKETTPLNQILGGYLRSAVRCLECGHVSTTFQHFQDLLLDIRKVGALDDALELYFSREKLDDMAYHCENCQKKVLATKQFSLERAPMVLCIQLKRFSVANNKITKHVTFRQRLELTRFARRKPQVPLVYRLVSLVTHVGQTVGCGHYTAVAQSPSGNYYQFDDSMVRPISQQSVFNTNAYIMLYELECPQHITTSPPKAQIICSKIYNKIAEEAHSTTKDIQSSSSANNNSIPHLNGLSVPKLPVTAHSSSSFNGNGRCQNGNTAHSDSSDSEPECVRTNNTNTNSVQSCSTSKLVNDGATTSSCTSSSTSCTTASTSYTSAKRPTLIIKENGVISSSSNTPKKTSTTKENGEVSSTSSNVPTMSKRALFAATTNAMIKENGSFPSSTSSNACGTTSNTSGASSKRTPINGTLRASPCDSVTSSKRPANASNHPTSSTTPMPLVPYEVDDSCSSAEESAATGEQSSTAAPPTVQTKAGSWQISSTTVHGPSLEGQAGWKQKRGEAVTELLHMSNEGYSAPVSTWNGTRAALDREVTNERREDRKRTMGQENVDKPKCKQPKYNNNSYVGTKSNPNYNPFQEHSNARKWQNDSHYYKQHNNYNNSNNGARHRYQGRRGGYHNNNRHREKFRH